jgi:hypothetical protein
MRGELAGRWRLNTSRLDESGDLGQLEKHTRQSAREETKLFSGTLIRLCRGFCSCRVEALGHGAAWAWVNDDDGLQSAGLVRRGHIDMRGFLLEQERG